jgi:hypothetical protein
MHLTTNMPGVTFKLLDDPLSTQIVLDARAQREFTLKVALRAIEDILWEVHFMMEHGEVDRIKATVAQFVEMDEHDQHPEGSFAFWEAFARRHSLEYLREALTDQHVGDCTCVACSCIKCHAEQLAEVDTLPGLGKHSTRLLGSALAGRFEAPYSQQQEAAIAFAEKHRAAQKEQDEVTTNPTKETSV